jgi:SAM-dependent methyltransferase
VLGLITVQNENNSARDKRNDVGNGSDSDVQFKLEADPDAVDPLAIFLSDPESHLSDILYLYFRIYKKKLLWSFAQTAFAKLNLESRTLWITDVGASMGFDILYLLRRLTRDFRDPLPYRKVSASLVEGDEKLIDAGERILKSVLAASEIDFQYYRHPLVEGLPLQDESQHLVICSEVVEHLQEPAELLQEVLRVLKPGGFVILTTDNSPSLLQCIKRIPIYLSGKYKKVYARPSPNSTVVTTLRWKGREYPVFGHINLNSTRYWEKLSEDIGFEIARFGTYESIRRGGGSKSPVALAGYFALGALVHLMPRRLGRFFGEHNDAAFEEARTVISELSNREHMLRPAAPALNTGAKAGPP